MLMSCGESTRAERPLVPVPSELSPSRAVPVLAPAAIVVIPTVSELLPPAAMSAGIVPTVALPELETLLTESFSL